LIDLALGVPAQGSGSEREGRPRARIQDQPPLKVEIVQLGFEPLLLARDRAQLIFDLTAGGKASTGGEKQSRPGEGSDADADSVR
jgi:hypothetical protein